MTGDRLLPLWHGLFILNVLSRKTAFTEKISHCRLGKPPKDPAIHKQELHLEWLESGERGDIERRFGIGKRCYSLGRITAKLKHTSEIMIHMSVLTLNLQKRLRFLLRFLFVYLRRLQVA